MKNFKRRFWILAAFSAIALAAVSGCSDKNKSSSSVDPNELRTPLEFHYESGDTDDDDSSGADLNAQDPTVPDNSGSENSANSSSSSESGGDSSSVNDGEETTEYIPVTEADGEPVTTYAVVTDAAGEPSTDDQGQTQTTAVQVTTAIKVTKPGGSSSQTQTTPASGDNNSSGYVSKIDNAYAMWIDVSKEEDFLFDGEFIKVTFKIKENTPNGVYDVTISEPDFSRMPGVSVDPDTVLNGKVYVGEKGEPQREVTDADGFALYIDNASGNPGDEVTVTFRMKNNPGMVAMLLWFDYDKNAMEIVECEAVGTFAEIAKASFGEDGSNK